jgi:hypothetical protein
MTTATKTGIRIHPPDATDSIGPPSYMGSTARGLEDNSHIVIVADGATSLSSDRNGCQREGTRQ